MKVEQLYKQTPVAKHSGIVVSGDRLFFDGDEYIIDGDGELKMIRTNRQLDQKLSEIVARLDTK